MRQLSKIGRNKNNISMKTFCNFIETSEMQYEVWVDQLKFDGDLADSWLMFAKNELGVDLNVNRKVV